MKFSTNLNYKGQIFREMGPRTQRTCLKARTPIYTLHLFIQDLCGLEVTLDSLIKMDQFQLCKSKPASYVIVDHTWYKFYIYVCNA